MSTLVVRRAGRKLFGKVREVGEVIEDDSLDWYHRKALIDNQTVEELPETVEPATCGCGRTFRDEETMERCGHGDCGETADLRAGDLFSMKTSELIEEARRSGVDLDGVRKTKSGDPSRPALISAISKARE